MKIKNIDKNESPIVFILLAFLFFLFLKSFFIDIMVVQGNSIYPAIKEGDILIINRQTYSLKLPFSNKNIINWKNPQKGEIIVFINPEDNRKVVKRCAGIPGDNIIVYNEGIIISNIEYKTDNFNVFSGYKTIPRNSLFVIGDNLSKSHDSRDYGFINSDTILGKVFFIKGNNNDK